MAPKRQKRKKHPVCGKVRYHDETAAYLALLKIWQQGSPRHAETRTYPCATCRGWHLTSQPRKQVPNTSTTVERR